MGICLDPHHLIRSGDSVADIASIEPDLLRYVQICDGPLVPHPAIAGTEAVCERLYPGHGALPLVDFLRAAPRDTPLGVECPSLGRTQSGASAVQQAIEAMTAMRRVLDAAG